MVTVVEIAKTTQENNVEYLAWFMENILDSRLRGITVWKTCTYAGGKVSYTCRSWLRGIRGLRGV